ncbi:MAG: ribosome biogenesis GTP-binding protein YihA/YsxC [Cyanobacteria bacterium P01_H01_bin.74]
MLTLRTAQYITSAPKRSLCPEENSAIPEIVFVGRSNVGKSSVINSLVRHKNLARTSNTPGKTRYINYYLLDLIDKTTMPAITQQLYFVDLPGYGYAKVSKKEQAQWQKHLEAYLRERQGIVCVVQLIDSRHGPQSSDLQLYDWLQHHGHNVVVVLSKTDKLARTHLKKHQADAARQLSHLNERHLILYSAQTHSGRDQLWSLVLSLSFGKSETAHPAAATGD